MHARTLTRTLMRCASALPTAKRTSGVLRSHTVHQHELFYTAPAHCARPSTQTECAIHVIDDLISERAVHQKSVSCEKPEATPPFLEPCHFSE